jgi:hypothetical protein
MLQIIRELPKPKGKLRWLVWVRWVRWYCQCQKQGCRPCPNWPVIFAKTENGDLQLCKKCRWEYDTVECERKVMAKSCNGHRHSTLFLCQGPAKNVAILAGLGRSQ